MRGVFECLGAGLYNFPGLLWSMLLKGAPSVGEFSSPGLNVK